MNTPILLITFNRPSHTRRVLEAILAAEPKDLYVFQDGAREGNEADVVKCQQVRDVINELTMHRASCAVHHNYSPINLGCGPGPMTAINWFFENVEQGIIFEDDCVAHPDFFLYCESLLQKYMDDDQISFIGGCNYGQELTTNCSYDFGSGHHETWGWATWKRKWIEFNYTLEDFDKEEFARIIKYYYPSIRQQNYWLRIFDVVKENQCNNSCWDYQFYFSMWRKKRLAIYPRVNLVSNVGMGDDATHTQCNNPLLSRKFETIFPLIHPERITINRNLDNYLMRQFIIPYEYGWTGIKRLPYKLNSFIKHLVGHQGPWLKHK